MTVTANNMDIASQSSGHTVVYMAPSVCITPAAPSPVPMPYPIMTPNGSKDSADHTESVLMKGKPIVVIGSLIASCKGNEAGTQKEVVSHKTSSSAFIMTASPNVKIEGAAVAFTGSTGMGNKM